MTKIEELRSEALNQAMKIHHGNGDMVRLLACAAAIERYLRDGTQPKALVAP